MNKYFKYRDGTRELIEDVLAGNSSKAFKYAPISYYKAIARKRVWDGIPHVTDLFNGARMQMLKHVVDAEIDIENAVWSITGLTGHRSLEIASGEEEIGRTWTAYGIQGTNDHLETIDGLMYIIDSKFYGSYAVTSKLGVYVSGEIDKLDKDGNPELYMKSGKWGKAGDPKKEKLYKYDVEKGESFDLVMQLNMYKLLAEENGFDINGGLRAFIIPRDGGTMVAKGRGVLHNLYMVSLPVREKGLVIDFIETQRDAIISAMETSKLILPGSPEEVVEQIQADGIKIPEPCSAKQCWDGRKCKGYCEVSRVCELLGDTPYFKPAKAFDSDLKGF